jgi:RimJ/RimL family protein N-acetyltransferase
VSGRPAPAALGGSVLTGRFIALEPLEPRHHDELKCLATDPELWTYMPRDMRGGLQVLLDWHAEQKAAGLQATYAVRRLGDGALVGSTSFLANVPSEGRVEIGVTWYARPAQGGPVNPEAKYLLLTHAFDAGYARVELKTDSRNLRSRAAILKLGAREEGTLRSHVWCPPNGTHDGYRRDTVYFSILAEEWPAVRKGLEQRLQAFPA